MILSGAAMIMAVEDAMLKNRIREFRSREGLSQQSLADRCAISRSEVSAIETGRLKPSAETALRLAGGLHCQVEDLFWMAEAECQEPAWAWGDGAKRYWSARVPAGLRRFPVESLAIGAMSGDEESARVIPEDTLVLATCDPAVGLLARELERAGIRCLPLTRSSREALSLLGLGLVHMAAIHLGTDEVTNAALLRSSLGAGYSSVHLACWEEGLACGTGVRTARLTPRALLRYRWIGRPVGSGARTCSDKLLESPKRPPKGYEFHARDHRAVAEAIRTGIADVGVCVRLAAEEAGLGFQSVRSESVDLCFRTDQLDSRLLRVLLATLRSEAFRKDLATLPGYDSSKCGEMS